MNTLLRTVGITAAVLAGCTAQATDFGPLMEVARSTWADKTHIGVVADYAASRDDIQVLAEQAGSDCRITVVDLRSHGLLGQARALMTSVVHPDFLVLLPRDPRVRDGSIEASLLVRQVARCGIPTIATSPVSLRQGAVFAVGRATGMELLVTDKLIGTVGVTLPRKVTFMPAQARLGHGPATVSVY